ncbi:MAG: helix-turn-helix domain-containing protein [Peptostreptococcaceae bacterium]
MEIILTESFIQVPPILNSKGVKHSVKSIYLALAEYKNQNTKIAFPSYNTISKKIGCSKSTISKGIKKLEEMGLIIVARSKKDGTNCNNVNQYLFLTNFKSTKNKIKTQKSVSEEKKALEKFNNLINSSKKDSKQDSKETNTENNEQINQENNTKNSNENVEIIENNPNIRVSKNDKNINNKVNVLENKSNIKNVISSASDITLENYKSIDVSNPNLTKQMRIKIMQLKAFGKSTL